MVISRFIIYAVFDMSQLLFLTFTFSIDIYLWRLSIDGAHWHGVRGSCNVSSWLRSWDPRSTLAQDHHTSCLHRSVKHSRS